MVPQFWVGKAKLFAAVSIVFLMMFSSGSPVSASSGSSAPDSVANLQQDTGTITVLKRFCEADNSPNQNSNCNGRVEEAEGIDVTFEVRAGADVTDGPVLETIVVSIVQQGNASQGSATGDALDADETFTVCEIPVDGFTPVPRPGSQGGSSQTLVAGEPCITVELEPGNNELQFDNFAELTTPDPNGSPVSEDLSDDDGSDDGSDDGADDGSDDGARDGSDDGASDGSDGNGDDDDKTVVVLPSTGTGDSDGSMVSYAVIIAGAALVAVAAMGSLRQRSKN